MEDFVPWMGWLGMGGTKRRMMRLAKNMDEIFQEIVDERRRRRRPTAAKAVAAGEEKTIVDVMLALQEQDPENYSDFIIKGMISALPLAARRSNEIHCSGVGLIVCAPWKYANTCAKCKSIEQARIVFNRM
ncbi:Cytochrome P450 81F1 [Platanthera zijinensis]|uniref:Cytochrome P450 81F1 n=1 Tax=Platanthera zijinensis TaxID=2320716 RepID=A0AAP0FYM4_9ASPA